MRWKWVRFHYITEPGVLTMYAVAEKENPCKGYDS